MLVPSSLDFPVARTRSQVNYCSLQVTCYYSNRKQSKMPLRYCKYLLCFLENQLSLRKAPTRQSPSPPDLSSLPAVLKQNREWEGESAWWGPGCSKGHLQAVHDCAAFPTIVLLLPLVHLADELQEGALGHGRIPVHRPAQELELLHHPVSILGLWSGEETGGIQLHRLHRLSKGQPLLPIL